MIDTGRYASTVNITPLAARPPILSAQVLNSTSAQSAGQDRLVSDARQTLFPHALVGAEVVGFAVGLGGVGGGVGGGEPTAFP